jgi:tRNA(Ile)-lysidine synthase
VPSASASAVDMTVPALTTAELATAFAAIGGFEPRPLVAVAVSGGPDSMALAILVDRWARERGGEAWALTVDHRLRPESAVEAATVGNWLRARGILHGILVWDGDKPATGIQEAARAARYRLLTAWCAARGCLHLLTAHHREDQAETYLIRRRAGSFVDGLAGTSAVRELPRLRVVRPLLGVPRARLAALLDAEGQEYLRDPSNRNPAFERSRLRMDMDGEKRGVALAGLRANAESRVERERALADLLAHSVTLHPAGFALVDPAPILAAGELGERVLGRVAGTIGGAHYPLRRERLARLRLSLALSPSGARTLGGCRFVPWRGRILVLRETARAAPPRRLDPGMPALWDNRFVATLPADAGPMTLCSLGAAGVAALGRHAVSDYNPLPRLVYPALAAFRDADGLAAIPHLDYCRASGTMPHLVFRPSAPLFGAGFTVV